MFWSFRHDPARRPAAPVFIELTEALACPICLLRAGRPPPQGLVTVVKALRERRVSAGHLGCPTCETRFPIRDGEIDFGLREAAGVEAGEGIDPAGGIQSAGGNRTAGGNQPAARIEVDGESPPNAVELAALLGLHPEARGYYLLDEGLAVLAGAVAGWAPGAEFLVLASEDESFPASEDEAPRASDETRDRTPDPTPGENVERQERRGGVTIGRGVPPVILPVLSARYRGVGLLGGHEPRVREAHRALGEGGRLVILRPGPGTRELAEEVSLEVLAAEPRALVAVRR